MAHFYGTINGARGQASRLGNKTSGLETVTASWQGAVRTHLYVKDNIDYVRVSLIPWRGAGINQVLYEGPVSGRAV